ncbi:MAG: tyrosine-type recombinase/integrase [Planctomycetota bacterium]|jgi:site-specific recombinase XerD
MGHLRDRMDEDLRLAGYSRSTHRIYLHYARQFAGHFMKSPADLGEEEVRTFLLHLLEERKLSHQSYRQAYAALKFLYAVTLKQPFVVTRIPNHRNKKRMLPTVLSGSEVLAILDAIENLKYRTIVMATYAAGLRISEACRLHVDDIDSKRMLIHVRLGKGGRDRYVMLSETLLGAMRLYWKHYRPQGFFFPGRPPRDTIATNSVAHILRCAVAAAGVRKKVTPHTLRHSFATHLMELGVNLRIVQILLGHADMKTTTLYTTVSSEHLKTIPSPLDVLGTPKAKVLG